MTVGYPTEHEPVNGIFVRDHALAVADHADVSILHLARGEPWRLARVAGEPFPTYRSGFPTRPAGAGLLASGIRGLHSAPAHDVVHAHFFLAALPCVLTRSRPLVITEHWSIFLPEDPASLSPGLRRAARLAFARADAVIAVSDALRRGLQAHGVTRPVQVVPNPVDTTAFVPGDGPRSGRLLSVGLLYDAKGYEHLLEAVSLLAERGVDVALDIVGDGPRRETYVALAEALGIGDRVRFLGALSREQIAAIMRDASLFVLASRYDNNPVSLIEAMASGLPVVATAVGGVPEIVDGDSGRLVEPGDSVLLADGIAAVLAGLDSFDRRAIARKAGERYGRGAVGRRLLAIYEDLVR